MINNNQNTFNMKQNQNNNFGGFNFNMNQNQNQTNNKSNDDDVFEEVKENGGAQPKPQSKGGLSSLLDTKLVNLDLLGPKKQNNNRNDFNSYW